LSPRAAARPGLGAAGVRPGHPGPDHRHRRDVRPARRAAGRQLHPPL